MARRSRFEYLNASQLDCPCSSPVRFRCLCRLYPPPVSWDTALLKAVPGTIRHGGAILNHGTVKLRTGAAFLDNKTGSIRDRVFAGDGGAIWNGKTGDFHMWGGVMAGNVAGGGGRGGAVWNEGVVHFHEATMLELNTVSLVHVLVRRPPNR